MQLLTALILAGAWIASNATPVWPQDTPAPGSQTQTQEGKEERSGEEKMEARGAQEADRMERKKGEEEMEARGAQKPGRMGRQGEGEGSSGERWSKEDAKKAQEALKNKGHDPGSIDGIIGPQTRQAIRAFQSVSGLKETGRLDLETAKKLGVEKTSGISSKGSTGMEKGQSSRIEKTPSSPMAK